MKKQIVEELNPAPISNNQVVKEDNLQKQGTLFTKREWILRYATSFKALMFMAGPMIIITLVNALYGIIDKQLTLNYAIEQVTIMVKTGILSGQLTNGTSIDAFASIPDLDLFSRQLINVSTQYSNTIITLLQAMSLLTAIGTAVRWGQSMGRRNKQEMDSILVTGFLQTLVMAIIGVLILHFLAPVIICAQANVAYADRNESIQFLLANDYTQKFIYGFPLLVTATFLSTLLRTEGKVWWIIAINLTSVVINMLAGELIMEHSPADQKMAGAVYGSIIAWGFSTIASILIIAMSKNTLLKPNLKKMKLTIRDAFSIWSFGFSPFLSNFVFAVGSFIMTLLITIMHPEPSVMDGVAASRGYIVIHFSDATGAVISTAYVSTAIRVLSAGSPWVGILWAPIVGMMQGGNSNYAYNKGSGNRYRIVQTFRIQALTNMIWGFVVIVIMAAAGGPMLALFDGPSDKGLWFYAYMCVFPFSGVFYSAVSLFQGTGQTKFASTSVVIRIIVFSISFTFIGWAIAKGDWNADTSHDWIIFMMFGLAEIPAAVIAGIFLYLTARKAIKSYQINNVKDEFTPPSLLQAALNEVTMAVSVNSNRINKIADGKIQKLEVEKKEGYKEAINLINAKRATDLETNLQKSRIKREKVKTTHRFDDETSGDAFERQNIALRRSYNIKKYKLEKHKNINDESLAKLNTWLKIKEDKLIIRQDKMRKEIGEREAGVKKVTPFTLLTCKTEPQPIRDSNERSAQDSQINIR